MRPYMFSVPRGGGVVLYARCANVPPGGGCVQLADGAAAVSAAHSDLLVAQNALWRKILGAEGAAGGGGGGDGGSPAHRGGGAPVVSPVRGVSSSSGGGGGESPAAAGAAAHAPAAGKAEAVSAVRALLVSIRDEISGAARIGASVPAHRTSPPGHARSYSPSAGQRTAGGGGGGGHHHPGPPLLPIQVVQQQLQQLQQQQQQLEQALSQQQQQPAAAVSPMQAGYSARGARRASFVDDGDVTRGPALPAEVRASPRKDRRRDDDVGGGSGGGVVRREARPAPTPETKEQPPLLDAAAERPGVPLLQSAPRRVGEGRFVATPVAQLTAALDAYRSPPPAGTGGRRGGGGVGASLRSPAS
jgi:hypothetical protein